MARGARAVVGGAPLDGPGYFYEPTVLVDVPPTRAAAGGDLRSGRAGLSFSSEEEAIAAANATEYGLVAYIYTGDLRARAARGRGVETGMIGLNQGFVSNAAAPFGGVKQSGFGREGGFEGIGEYLETKYVAVGGL